MKNLLTLVFALAFAAVLQGAPNDGQAQDKKTPQVIISKPASEDVAPQISENLPPPLTEKVAKLAAIMAVAFERLPQAFYDKEEARVAWLLAGQFKLEDVRYDRYSALYQIDDRTYAGVDFATQEGKLLTLQAFELETPEPPVRNAKVKIVEKDSASTSFFIFDLDEIEKATQKALQELPKKQGTSSDPAPAN